MMMYALLAYSFVMPVEDRNLPRMDALSITMPQVRYQSSPMYI